MKRSDFTAYFRSTRTLLLYPEIFCKFFEHRQTAGRRAEK